MLQSVSVKLTNLFIQKQIITAQQRPVFEYGFMLTISTLLCVLSILLIAFVCDALVAGILFLAVFMPLRSCCGGYHCKTYGACFIVTNMVFSVYLFLLNRSFFALPGQILSVVAAVLAVLSAGLIFKFAPVLHKNNPQTKAQQRAARKRARLLASCFTFVLLIGICLSHMLHVSKYYFFAMSLTMAVVAAMMGMALVKERRDKHG